jgi:hypothetical protein
VFGSAIVIFTPFVVVEVAVDAFVESYSEEHGGIPKLLALALVPVASATVGGAAIFAGALERIVGAHHFGQTRHPALALVRGLPLKRLIVADVLLVFATVIGYALFVIPGLVAFTFFCLVGPMVTIEGNPVGAAFRRSAQLVAPHFLLVFALVTLPVAIEEAIFHTLTDVEVVDPGFFTYLVDGLVAALIGAAIGVIEVVLAYRLSRRYPAEPVS